MDVPVQQPPLPQLPEWNDGNGYLIAETRETQHPPIECERGGGEGVLAQLPRAAVPHGGVDVARHDAFANGEEAGLAFVQQAVHQARNLHGFGDASRPLIEIDVQSVGETCVGLGSGIALRGDDQRFRYLGIG